MSFAVVFVAQILSVFVIVTLGATRGRSPANSKTAAMAKKARPKAQTTAARLGFIYRNTNTEWLWPAHWPLVVMALALV